jgi:hypothetical protein
MIIISRYDDKGGNKQTQKSEFSYEEKQADEPERLRQHYGRRRRKSHSQPTGTVTQQNAQSRKGVYHGQHLPTHSLGEQQRARTVHIILTLCKSHAQFPVSTVQKPPPGESKMFSSSFRRCFRHHSEDVFVIIQKMFSSSFRRCFRHHSHDVFVTIQKMFSSSFRFGYPERHCFGALSC